MAQNKIKDILTQQRGLAEQMRAHQQQAARDAYAQGQRSLTEQLRQQRSSMQQNREQLAQQAHLAQRNIQQGATSRGLGSSGIRDLSTLQSQMAQGDALSRLTMEDAALQREALNTRLGLSEQLASQMMGSESQYLQALLDSDRFGLEREDIDRDTLLQLVEMTQADGADASLIAQMAEIAFGDLDNFRNLLGGNTGEGIGEGTGKTGSYEDFFGNLTGGQNPEDIRISATEWDQAATILSVLDPFKTIAFLGSGIADALKSPKDRAKLTWKEAPGLIQAGHDLANTITGRKGDDKVHFYNIDGERKLMTRAEALKEATNRYGNLKPVRDKDITITMNANGDIRYRYRNKTYGTYEKAKDKYDDDKNKK